MFFCVSVVPWFLSVNLIFRETQQAKMVDNLLDHVQEILTEIIGFSFVRFSAIERKQFTDKPEDGLEKSFFMNLLDLHCLIDYEAGDDTDDHLSKLEEKGHECIAQLKYELEEAGIKHELDVYRTSLHGKLKVFLTTDKTPQAVRIQALWRGKQAREIVKDMCSKPDVLFELEHKQMRMDRLGVAEVWR